MSAFHVKTQNSVLDKNQTITAITVYHQTFESLKNKNVDLH